ncbi:hypothetical protein BGZ58_005606 [Dissophora ornata]|nr:hypothetical protein BGZ58_005606 [Dissophora ornata]
MESNTHPAATDDVDKAIQSTSDATPVASPSVKVESDTPIPTGDTTTAATVIHPDTSGTKDETSVNTTHPTLIAAATNADPDTLSIVPNTDPTETANHASTDPTIDATAAAAAAAAQAIASAFHDTTADDIKALTKALTTPIEQIEAEDHAAAAAAVAAVAASVAAGTGADQPAQPEPTQPPQTVSAPAFDVNNVYNQVLSLTSHSQKPAGKRTAQDDFEQNQAARALQLIALSLNSSASQAAELAGLETNGQASEIIKVEATQPSESASFEQVLKAHAAASASSAPDASDSLIAISHAINFPSQANSTSKLEVDTNAFAQAVLNATQADVNKSNQSNVDGTSTSASLNGDTSQSAVDQSELHKVHLNAIPVSGVNTGATSTVNPSTSSASSSTQGFTFEVDKATGKTQIKWTTDPKDDVSSVLQDANAIQQALQTLIANSGIPGLSDLGVTNGGLLAPPLGQFPAQGSEFGTAQDPVVPEPPTAPTPPARKKRKTGGSSTQNTAASIPEGAPSYPCTFEGCDKVFARLYNLKSHSRTHTNERPFVCNHCQLAFSRNHDLKRHVKIHGGDKPFKCSGCGKSFSRLDALGRHRGNAKNRAGCQGGAEAA